MYCLIISKFYKNILGKNTGNCVLSHSFNFSTYVTFSYHSKMRSRLHAPFGLCRTMKGTLARNQRLKKDSFWSLDPYSILLFAEVKRLSEQQVIFMPCTVWILCLRRQLKISGLRFSVLSFWNWMSQLPVRGR